MALFLEPIFIGQKKKLASRERKQRKKLANAEYRERNRKAWATRKRQAAARAQAPAQDKDMEAA